MIITRSTNDGRMAGFLDLAAYEKYARETEGQGRTCWEDEVYDVGAGGPTGDPLDLHALKCRISDDAHQRAEREPDELPAARGTVTAAQETLRAALPPQTHAGLSRLYESDRGTMEILDGTRVVLPVSRAHAEAMLVVAADFLKRNPQ